jgi:MoaA/NifB/PqqE/SkfB family radical SAM enzyme/GT2 family glycosyltransferase
MQRLLKVGRQNNNECEFWRYLDKDSDEKKLKDIEDEVRGFEKKDTVIICGGEPTIRKDFFKIMDMIEKRDFKKVILETNGRMFCYDDFLERITKYSIDKFAIHVYSDNNMIHDKITNSKGSFRQTLKGIINLRKIHKDVRFIVVICKENYQHLHDIVKLAARFNIREIQLLYPESAPEEYFELEKIVPPITKAVGFIDQAYDFMTEKGINIISGNTPFNFCSYPSERVKKGIHISDEGYKKISDSQENPSQIPYVSIVIPTFNRSKILKNTITSLCNQTYPSSDFEVIVVDDGSKDDTPEMIKSLKTPFRIRYYAQNDLGYGAGRARNLGVKKAAGELIIFLDTDVISDPDNIKEHVRMHMKEKKLLVIGTRLDMIPCKRTETVLAQDNIIDNFDSIRQLPMKPDMREDFFYWSNDQLFTFENPWIMLYTNNVSFRKKDFIRCGMFDESFIFWSVEDQELGYRFYMEGIKFVLNRKAIGYHQPHKLVYGNHEGMTKAIKYNARLFYKKFLNRKVYDMYHSFFAHSEEEIKIEKNLDTEKNINEYLGKKVGKKISIADIKKQIDLAKGEKVKTIVLSGGEPAISERFFEIVQMLRKERFKNICIDTSGQALSDIGFCRKTVSSGANKFIFSVAGPDHKSHNELFGTGTFEKTSLAIKNVRQLKKDIKLNLIVWKKNVHLISEMVRFAHKQKISEIEMIMPLCEEEDDQVFNEAEIPVSNIIYLNMLEGLKLAKKLEMKVRSQNVYSDFLALNTIISKRMYDLFSKDLAVSRGPLH